MRVLKESTPRATPIDKAVETVTASAELRVFFTAIPGRSGLVFTDEFRNVEQRQIEGDDDNTDDGTQEHDQHRFEN